MIIFKIYNEEFSKLKSFYKDWALVIMQLKLKFEQKYLIIEISQNFLDFLILYNYLCWKVWVYFWFNSVFQLDKLNILSR